LPEDEVPAPRFARRTSSERPPNCGADDTGAGLAFGRTRPAQACPVGAVSGMELRETLGSEDNG
jgi:hypothetical protein